MSGHYTSRKEPGKSCVSSSYGRIEGSEGVQVGGVVKREKQGRRKRLEKGDNPAAKGVRERAAAVFSRGGKE